jgi:predicted DNA-binding transcriptional regulator AlpA
VSRKGSRVDGEDLLNRDEVMAYLGVGRTTVYRKLRHLALELRMGGSRPILRWRRADLDALSQGAGTGRRVA